ncbi:hypothetical protein [Arthrobacter sp. UYCu712]
MLSKKERIEKEARFWVLMAQGSTLIAACCYATNAGGSGDDPLGADR